MTSDEELLEDEEEILVYVELEGVVGGNTLTTEQLQLDMIGIDTEHPIMQINGRFYEGTYEDAIGTYMFFTKDENTEPEDPVFDTASTLKYYAKTRKLLKMQRIFIKHRTEVLGDSEDSRCIPNLNTIVEAGVPIEQQEEALSFWKTIRDGRMNALNSYLEKQRIREEKKAQGITVDSESDEDNPFIAYKHNVKTNVKSVNQPADGLSELKDVENHGNIEEAKETAEKNEQMAPIVCDGVSELENLALHETNPDKPEKTELADFCARLSKEDKMDTTIQEEIAKDVRTVQVEEMSTMEIQTMRRLKREAKIKEIAERLKTIAQCSTSAKLN